MLRLFGIFALSLFALLSAAGSWAAEAKAAKKTPRPNFEAPLEPKKTESAVDGVFSWDSGKTPLLKHPIPSLQEARPGQSEVPLLTLETSVAEAIHSATGVQKSQGEFEISGEQLIQSYAEFLPNLTALGTENKTVGRAYVATSVPTWVDANNRGPAYQVSSTLNIFNGFSDLASLKSSLARKEAAQLNLKRAKQQIALDVAQTYLQLILDSELVKIAKENLVASQARENLLSEQTRVGVRNLSDLFRQQAQTSSDEAFLVNSESKERSDELLLLRKLRLDASRNYKVVSPKLEEEADPNVYNDEDKLVQEALENRPDLMSSVQNAKAAAWDVTSLRANYFPHLDFGVTVGSAARLLDHQLVNGQDVTPADQMGLNDQLAHQVQYTVGLTLTWNLFDRWLSEANVQRSKVGARNARLDSEDRKNQVVAEIRQAYGDYRSVLQQLESTRKGLQASRKAYEVMQGRYQVGSASFVDLTLAQAALVQAEAARAQALIAFALQKRSLDTVLGVVKVD